MCCEKQELALAAKSMIYSCELLLQQAKKLEQACGGDQPSYGTVAAVMRRIMDCSSRVDRKIGELSLLL